MITVRLLREDPTPILLPVTNTDTRDHAACICIGYLPDLSLETSHSQEVAKEAMHDLRQTYMDTIFDAIEECGEHGFI